MQLATPNPPAIPRPTIKATALAYAIFDRPDLKKAEEYLIDFGLRPVSNDGQTLLLRGTAPSPFCYVVRKAARAAVRRPRASRSNSRGRSRSAGEAAGRLRDRDAELGRAAARSSV